MSDGWLGLLDDVGHRLGVVGRGVIGGGSFVVTGHTSAYGWRV